MEVKNTILNQYISQLDELEIELSEQERKDFDDLNKLLENHQHQEKLSTEIWNTIQEAAIDSIEQIIGLDDRGDWRPEQGAVITTPLNFRNGIVASEADKKRFELWKSRIDENGESASQFRNRVVKSEFDKLKTQYKASKRNADGSYNNEYNDTILYDYTDPHAYFMPDSSGDMKANTRLRADVDHGISVKENYKDDKIGLYGDSTKDGVEKNIKDICNNYDNFAITDEHANKSMHDKDTLEVAVSNPDLNLDPEKVKEKMATAEKAKNKYLFKNAIGEKSKEFAVGVTKSTLAATGKMLIGKAMKIVVSETVVEFRITSDETLLDRIKKLIEKIIIRAKRELSHIWNDIKEFAVNNAVSEIVNLILNYFVSTVKNVFKLIRCLFGSIVSAFKIIFDSGRPWEDRIFEALKIISAGIAMATGTMLNELIAKAIATNIPFLAGYAGDISAVISGLISSILSALVLMSFDRYKASLQINDEERQIQLLNMQLVSNGVAHAQVSAARASVIVAQTTELVKRELISIVEHDCQIEAYTNMIRESINRQQELHAKIDKLQQVSTNSQNSLNQIRETNNRTIDNKLNKLTIIDND